MNKIFTKSEKGYEMSMVEQFTGEIEVRSGDACVALHIECQCFPVMDRKSDKFFKSYLAQTKILHSKKSGEMLGYVIFDEDTNNLGIQLIRIAILPKFQKLGISSIIIDSLKEVVENNKNKKYLYGGMIKGMNNDQFLTTNGLEDAGWQDHFFNNGQGGNVYVWRQNG